MKAAAEKDLILLNQSNQFMFVMLAKLIAKTSSPDAVVAFLEEEKKTEGGKVMTKLIERMIESARSSS